MARFQAYCRNELAKVGWIEPTMARFNHTSINELAKVDGLEQVEGLEQWPGSSLLA